MHCVLCSEQQKKEVAQIFGGAGGAGGAGPMRRRAEEKKERVDGRKLGAYLRELHKKATEERKDKANSFRADVVKQIKLQEANLAEGVMAYNQEERGRFIGATVVCDGHGLTIEGVSQALKDASFAKLCKEELDLDVTVDDFESTRVNGTHTSSFTIYMSFRF